MATWNRKDKNAIKKYEKKLKRASAHGIDVVGAFVQKKVIRVLSKPAGSTTIPVKRQTPGGNKNTRTVFRNPSKPGQPPRVRSGNLMRNIFHKHLASKGVSRVGWRANAIYGYFHEVGIQYARAGFQQRPHLMVTIVKQKKAMQRISA